MMAIEMVFRYVAGKVQLPPNFIEMWTGCSEVLHWLSMGAAIWKQL